MVFFFSTTLKSWGLFTTSGGPPLTWFSFGTKKHCECASCFCKRISRIRIHNISFALNFVSHSIGCGQFFGFLLISIVLHQKCWSIIVWGFALQVWRGLNFISSVSLHFWNFLGCCAYPYFKCCTHIVVKCGMCDLLC